MHSTEQEERLLAAGSPYATEEIFDPQAGRPLLCFKRAPRTLLDILRKAAAHGGRDFLLDGTVKDWTSYAAVFGSVAKLANNLQCNFGVRQGDRVGIYLGNRGDSAIALLAIIWAGAVPVLLSSDSASLRPALDAFGCSLVLYDEELPFLRCNDVAAASAFSAPLAKLWEVDSSPLPICEDVAAGDVALIAFTSGTTGKPKGVVLTHRSMTSGLMNMMLGGTLLAMRRAAIARPELANVDRVPCTMLLSPLYHASGYLQLFLQLVVGGKLILAEAGISPEGVVDAAARHRAKSIVGITPDIVRTLVSSTKAGADLNSLRGIHINGYAAHETLIKDARAALPHIVVGTSYGLTETNGAVCVIDGAELEERPGSSGRMLPTVKVSIRAPDGSECQREQTGEIWLSGAMLGLGYITAEGHKPFERGWLQTGDVGFISSDGHLFLVDRKNNTLEIGGRKVSCLALERYVATLPGVKDSAVIGTRPSAHAGPILVAVVLERSVANDANFLPKDFFSRFYLQEADVSVLEVPAIPRNSTGKPDYSALNDLSSGLAGLGA